MCAIPASAVTIDMLNTASRRERSPELSLAVRMIQIGRRMSNTSDGTVAKYSAHTNQHTNLNNWQTGRTQYLGDGHGFWLIFAQALPRTECLDGLC